MVVTIPPGLPGQAYGEDNCEQKASFWGFPDELGLKKLPRGAHGGRISPPDCDAMDRIVEGFPPGRQVRPGLWWKDFPCCGNWKPGVVEISHPALPGEG